MIIILEGDEVNVLLLNSYCLLIGMQPGFDYQIFASFDELARAVVLGDKLIPAKVTTVFSAYNLANDTTGIECLKMLIGFGFKGNLVIMHSDLNDNLHREVFGKYTSFLSHVFIVNRRYPNMLHGALLFAASKELQIAKNQWRLH